MGYKVITLIPIFKDKLTDNEEIILDNNISKLNKNSDIVFICPNDLNIEYYKQFNIRIIKFNNEYFKSPKAYNKLLLNVNFYKTFEDYDFMLICHLDAYVFSNKLEYWCNKDYDYIGAPWLNPSWLPNKKCVGNGGFSLRKIKTYIDLIPKYDNLFRNSKLNEDYLLSEFLKQKEQSLKIPDYIEGANFAWETKLDECKKITNGVLPFAIHGIK